ncbi:hypothetical protein Q5530_26690 [Saccharothrix sp. BKS2]|uniref:hypothetical protein n=1 Tax=Saccharothrix sp. BKS2 TaxID=3064400 RepID=UPI0039ED02B4
MAVRDVLDRLAAGAEVVRLTGAWSTTNTCCGVVTWAEIEPDLTASGTGTRRLT